MDPVLKRSGSGLGSGPKRRKSGDGQGAPSDPLGQEVNKPEVCHALLMNPWLQSCLKSFDTLWAKYENVGRMLKEEIEVRIMLHGIVVAISF